MIQLASTAGLMNLIATIITFPWSEAATRGGAGVAEVLHDITANTAWQEHQARSGACRFRLPASERRIKCICTYNIRL